MGHHHNRHRRAGYQQGGFSLGNFFQNTDFSKVSSLVSTLADSGLLGIFSNNNFKGQMRNENISSLFTKNNTFGKNQSPKKELDINQLSDVLKKFNMSQDKIDSMIDLLSKINLGNNQNNETFSYVNHPENFDSDTINEE